MNEHAISLSLRHKAASTVVEVSVNAGSEAAVGMRVEETPFDFETVFHAHYERIARVIVRVVRDTGRAEELAVEVFWKLWRNPSAHGPNTRGWLYRAAVRVALDELRRQSRREKYERLFGFPGRVKTPEELQAASEEQLQVRAVLAALARRQAELLLLRGEDLSYQDIAQTLQLNPASVGTLLGRAQQAFRKEYVKRYGNHK
jgi:RNA polymerase sigma-70 factor (ECF subfamily)